MRPRSEVALAVSLLGVLVLLAAWLGRRPAPDTDERPSTFSVAPGGSRGLLDAVKRLGIPVRRFRERAGALSGIAGEAGVVLVILAPSAEFSAPERSAVLAFAEDADLLLAGRNAQSLMRCFGYRVNRRILDSAAVAPPGLGPGPRAPWVRATLSGTGQRVVVDSSRASDVDRVSCVVPPLAGVDTLLLSTRGRPVALRLRRADRPREVVLVADEELFRNRALRRTEAGPFVLGLFAGRYQRVVFEEYHHGHGAAGSLSALTIDWSRRSPWGRLVWQAAVVGLLALVFGAVRFGPPRPGIPRGRLAGLAHPPRRHHSESSRPGGAWAARFAHQARTAVIERAPGRECRGGCVGGSEALTQDEVDRHAETAGRVLGELGKVVLGQDAALRETLLALLARGHVLLEGPPGTAKTLLIRALNEALGLSFRRIQFTPDLMPSDVTGVSMLTGPGSFGFRPGPLFADLVLADEINRAPAKTQAALLEAMEERSVTVDGERHGLSAAFTVFATQNPIEFEGTYPLPEAELDRFMLKCTLDYPDAATEEAVLNQVLGGFESAEAASFGITRVLDAAGLVALREAVRRVRVEPALTGYITALVRSTRGAPALSLGASPRASVALLKLSQAAALVDGREYVVPDDVKALATPVLRHRVILAPELELEGVTADAALATLIERVEAPRA